MKSKHTALVAALIACGAVHGVAAAQSMPEVKFSGFGTLAAVHSSDANSDFVGSIFQSSGAGHTRSVSLNPDSKIGGQMSVNFTDKLSGVIQVVVQNQYDNSTTPQVEWANLKYQLLPELSLRAGRIAAPFYMLSESRFVGYSYAWVRPPVEVYSVLPVTSNDGVDLSWRSQVGGANNSLQVFYGQTTAKLPGGRKVESKTTWGINDSVEIGSLTLRAGFNSFNVDLDIPALQPLLNAATQMGLTEVANKYKLEGMKISAFALGANFDPGDWFVTGELIDFKGKGVVGDSRAWFVSAGYRFGTLTPYVTHATTKAGITAETGAGPLNGAFNSAMSGLTPTQNASSVGLRWDAMKNVAIKAQYDRLTTGNQSNGRLRPFPGFVQGSSVNVATVAVDFVF